MVKIKNLVAPTQTVVVAQLHTLDHMKKLEETILALVEVDLNSRSVVDVKMKYKQLKKLRPCFK